MLICLNEMNMIFRENYATQGGHASFQGSQDCDPFQIFKLKLFLHLSFLSFACDFM